MNCLVISALSN